MYFVSLATAMNNVVEFFYFFQTDYFSCFNLVLSNKLSLCEKSGVDSN
jgi:hypothetical protein